MEIVIASHNLHKIREIRDFFKVFKNLDLLSLLNFPDFIPDDECGDNLKDIAVNKAVKAAKELNKWTIADDSGLFVPALGGVPGVYSRRYASENASDSENRAKLLKSMADMEQIDRSAYYECCLVLASPEGVKKIVVGSCHGEICHEERGRNGFGYDSLFVKNDYDKTFAELEDDVKKRISHRSKAFEKLLPLLESMIS